MSDVVIQVDQLGKKFRRGARPAYGRFSELLVNGSRACAQWAYRQASSLFVHRGDRSAELAENEFWALKDVSFEVKRGEVLGIIGRNGAGKSTLLKLLSRITRPTTGEIRLRGRVGSLLEVGTGFHPELTGRENVYLNGTILGMRKREIDRRFDEIVAFAEIDQFLDTPVKHYSSGMYMRLAFAVAAHLEPEILVVDEVLAVGDAQFQKKCLGKMGEVARGGRTVLFVSHNMGAVEQHCTVAALLESGCIVSRGQNVRAVVRRHLQSECQTCLLEITRQTHPVDGNSCFQLERLAIVDATGAALSGPIRNDADAWVQIEGTASVADPSLNLGYAIHTDDGMLLYYSLSTDSAEAEWPSLQPGYLAVRSQLPQRFLNEGVYHISALVTLHCRAAVYTPGVNAPSVTIQIEGGLSESPYWLQARPGVLAPAIPWRRCIPTGNRMVAKAAP